jgi:RimJ/RimL family protein N-acetyltransferase
MAPLRTQRLLLEPLVAAHAEPMFAVLGDPAIYRHLDYGPPPSVDHLRSVYQRLEQRRSPDGSEAWLNWAVSLLDGPCIGYVQATVTPGAAWAAYVLASAHWGRGYAREATGAMLRHVTQACAVRRWLAVVEGANRPSIALLEALRFRLAAPGEASTHGLSATELLWVRDGDGT